MTGFPHADSGFKKFSGLRKQLGLWNALLYSANRLLETVSGGNIRIIRYYIFAQPVKPPPSLSSPKNRGRSIEIEFCRADSPDRADFPRPPLIIEGRFQRGHRCLQARLKGEFAAYLWLAREFYDEDEVRCRFILPDSRHSVWDYDVYVVPRYRLGRTFSRLWDTANKHLATEGVSWSFSRISAFNPDSIHPHARLGSIRLLNATFIIIGSFQLSILTIAPYLHLSWSTAKHPNIHLPSPEQTCARE